MKKKKLTKMALLGLAHGLLLNGQIAAVEEMEKLGELFSGNPQLFADLSQDAKILMTQLKHASDGSIFLAKGCGAQCSSVAKGCGAQCSSVAKGCGAHCGTVADRDVSKTNLQDPSTVTPKKDNYKEVDYNSENMNYHLMTENELMLELNDEGVKLYKSLSPEGKQLALKVASQACNNTNECKGLNACQTEKNTCAGKAACKGQSKCAFSDKNLAVKVVADKMAAKRKQTLGR